MGLDAVQQFTWPPKPLDADDTDRQEITPGHDQSLQADERERGFWSMFETALLGGGGGAEWLANWTPDPVQTICRRCGDVVGLGESDETGCGTCRGARLAWDRAIRLGLYAGPLRSSITACKYRNDRRAGRAVADLLACRVFEQFGAERIDLAGVLVVPVPTTTRRRLANAGLDHTLLLAAEIGRSLGVRPRRLLERRHTAHQAGLSAAARARNVAGTIRVRHGLRVARPDHVVLVDDVRTTGATASACLRAIKSRFRSRWADAAGGDKGFPRCWLATAAVSSRRRAAAWAPPQNTGFAADSDKNNTETV